MIHLESEAPEVLATLDGKAAFAQMGADSSIVEGLRLPFMPANDSVDFRHRPERPHHDAAR